ncbi:glycoside hydrolase family 105 protein [Neolewinella agarilytica]|uniref:glycoside hydrolase family 88/105 protein n=1 Tax=Neolewinella agarilytica TaxID=478744 RepID=UPI00235582A0|nr:glycoside hydrolase family 88 protein [Neolewinella agarilytica]
MKIHQLILPLLFIALLASCGSAPKTGSSGDIESAMVKALQWQEANPIYAKDPTDWTNGAYYTGVARAYESTKNPVFLQAIEDMGERTEWKTWERYYHADDVAISYSYLTLDEYKLGVVDKAPTAKWIEDHLYKDHEWKQGTRKDDKIINWWWCDALFMAPPVLVKWSNLKNDRRYLQQMHKYYMETYDLLYDQEEHLFARDTRFVWTGSPDDRKGDNGKKIFWSRGNGWVIGGLALMLEEMPKNYEHYNWYLNLYKEMAAKIKEIQPKDGMWRVSLLEPEAWPHGETSGTGFYTFALAWGINNGVLDKGEYGGAVKKAWKALTEVQQADGKVTWVQNIGYDPKPASADSWQNFGTGAFLMAGSEVRKMK